MIRRALVLLAPAAAQADFGLVPGTTAVTTENRDGTIATQAGVHPFALTVHFELSRPSPSAVPELLKACFPSAPRAPRSGR